MYNREQQVDVSTMLNNIAAALSQNRQTLDQIGHGTGRTHGDRVAQAFSAAAQAAQQAPTNDAGEQLLVAAEAMRREGKGKSIPFYADGLEEAGQQMHGKQSISAADLGSLISAFTGGVQKNNPAQPGQGSMLDALLPAAAAFLSTKQGQDLTQAALDAIIGSVSGAQSTAGRSGDYDWAGGRAPGPGGIDPGAASATNVIGGLIGSVLPGVLGALSQGAGGARPTGATVPSGTAGAPGMDDILGGLLGGMLGSQAYGQPAGQTPPRQWGPPSG
jgi:phosphoenolpyruvate---glycerone phosphotransferase subunit DhaL